MKPEERLSTDTYLIKGYDLGLFVGYSLDLGSAILTRQTVEKEVF